MEGRDAPHRKVHPIFTKKGIISLPDKEDGDIAAAKHIVVEPNRLREVECEGLVDCDAKFTSLVIYRRSCNVELDRLVLSDVIEDDRPELLVCSAIVV